MVPCWKENNHDMEESRILIFMRRFAAIILSFLIWGPSFAQEFNHYDITDGLSSIEVTDIKENDNFMWIATCDGLNRFDGENFKIYKRENGSKNCLTENNIETLFFDSGGYLWIGLKTGGADIYDPRKDVFTPISKIIKGKVPARVVSIMEDSQKNIWLGTWEEGLIKLVPDHKGAKSYHAETFCPGYIVSALIEKPRGYIRVGTYFGYFVYNMNTGKLISQGGTNEAITQFLDTGEENSVWCSTWSSGLLKIRWNSNDPARMRIADEHKGDNFRSIYRITGSNDNKIYLGTWGHGVKEVNITHPEESHSLGNNTLTATLINCLFRDKYNNIWIGTYGGGIYRFNAQKNGIGHFPATGSLPAPATSLAPFGKDYLLTGTQGAGVFLIDLKNKKMMPKFGNSGTGDLNNYILSLYSGKDLVIAGHDGTGFGWVASKPDPLFHFNDYFSGNQLEKITACFPSDDRLWIGTKQDGLFSVQLTPPMKRPENLIHYESFGRDEITGFAMQDSRHLFISSHNGLFLFNTSTNKINDNGRIIRDEIVYRIVKDNRNNCLWVGTSTNLLKINLEKTFLPENAFPEDLLPKGAIRALILDRDNNLWFSIGERLFCSLSNRKRVKEINPSLLGNHAILSSSSISFQGQDYLVFGTTDNLIMIDPRQALNQPDESKIVFTNMEIDHRKVGVNEKFYGNVVLNKATEYVSSIVLSYRCRWISLSFTETGWDFYKNKYQYRIKGFSDTWQYLNLSYPITFSQLNPGEYTLEIKKYDGWEDSPVNWSMNFIITPPWWQTIWFYLLLAFLITLGASILVIAIINYYKKKQVFRLKAIEKRKEEELLKEKESFFTGLSHDLLTPFSLILAPVNDLLRESKEDDPRREKLEIIGKNTSFLSDIFKTILDFKRAELTDTRVKETTVEIVSFTRLIVNAFDYLAKSRKISLSFTSEIEILPVLTDNVKIERILYNLLSNAIKYTPEGGEVSASLNFEEGSSMLRICIRDNGSGIGLKNQSLIFDKFYREPERPDKKNAQGLGLGLYVVKKFTELLNGYIELRSEPGKGTEIQVSLPVKVVRSEKIQEDASSALPEDIPTILITEDNEQMRKYLSEKLSAHFNVITASNGQQALDYIEEYLPEIIISDVMMPGMDGFSLCREIKENSRYADIFVILLTARTSTDDELQGYKAGADIYIKKPFDSEVLLNQIINIQNTRKKRKSQLLSRLVSKEDYEIEFDPKETFLQRSMQVIEEHLMDPDFKIDEFASEMNMSKTVLHRKFRLSVGQTPNQFIRLVRLRKSVNLLRNTDHSIAEIAYLTGFNQSHYFIKCFREVYHETPKSFRLRK